MVKVREDIEENCNKIYDEKIIITRRIEFDAAHRIIDHESKCKYVHGHRYVAEFSFIGKKLDKLGRVLDFGIIREILSDWINDHLDHNIILSRKDKKLGDFLKKHLNQQIYYLDEQPTAENIAYHLLFKICKKLFKKYEVECKKIKLYETPNCYAEVCI